MRTAINIHHHLFYEFANLLFVRLKFNALPSLPTFFIASRHFIRKYSQGGISPIHYFKKVMEPALVGLSTCSAAAAFPFSMRAQQQLEVADRVSGFTAHDPYHII